MEQIPGIAFVCGAVLSHHHGGKDLGSHQMTASVEVCAAPDGYKESGASLTESSADAMIDQVRGAPLS